VVPTGIVIENCPADVYLRIAPRSGLALKFGLMVLAGVVDSDYRGEISVILLNTGDVSFNANAGERIAQLIPTRLAPVDISEPTHAPRGTRGFGSTGY
jgi:dUTP pyrophosphatase